jgi:hypothetical protein
MVNMNSIQAVPPRLLYPREDAAYILGISKRNLDYRLANKEFETRRIGKRILITHASLVKFSQANHFDSLPVEQSKKAA